MLLQPSPSIIIAPPSQKQKMVLVVNHAPNLLNFAMMAAGAMKEQGASVMLVCWTGFKQTHAIGNSEAATEWANDIINNLRDGTENNIDNRQGNRRPIFERHQSAIPRVPTTNTILSRGELSFDF